MTMDFFLFFQGVPNLYYFIYPGKPDLEQYSYFLTKGKRFKKGKEKGVYLINL